MATLIDSVVVKHVTVNEGEQVIVGTVAMTPKQS